MQAIRFPLAAAIGLASGLALAQAPAPSAAPVTAPAAPAAPAPAAPASAAAPGQAGAAPAPGSGAQQRAPRPKDKARAEGSEPRRQLQTLYVGLMSDAEIKAYVAKVRDLKTYPECMSLLEATHKTMEPRAQAQGKTIRATPAEACEKAKARGRLTG